MQCVAVCCSVLQRVAVCCRVLQCVAVWLKVCAEEVCCSMLQCVAVCCSVLHCVAVCCSAAKVICRGGLSRFLPLSLSLSALSLACTRDCNTLQHTATQCNTFSLLQHTATQCNTMQHTLSLATHCSTLSVLRELTLADAHSLFLSLSFSLSPFSSSCLSPSLASLPPFLALPFLLVSSSSSLSSSLPPSLALPSLFSPSLFLALALFLSFHHSPICVLQCVAVSCSVL